MDPRARARFHFLTDQSRQHPCNFPNRRLAMPVVGDLLPEEFQHWTMLGELIEDLDENGVAEGYVEWLNQRPSYLLQPGFEFVLVNNPIAATRGTGGLHARCEVLAGSTIPPTPSS